MLRDQSAKVVCFFAADFKPRIDFLPKAVPAAVSIERALSNVDWQVTGGTFVIKSQENPILVVLDHKRLYLQTVGFSSWADSLNSHGDLIHNALEAYEVNSLTRLGFKATAVLDVGLTNDEVRECLFGSFVRSKATLPKVFGSAKDAIAQIDGTTDGYSYKMSVTALDDKEARTNLASVPNVKLLVDEIGAPLQGINELRASIKNGFSVDLDIFKRDVESSELRIFLPKSLELTEQMTDAAVRLLKSLPERG